MGFGCGCYTGRGLILDFDLGFIMLLLLLCLGFIRVQNMDVSALFERSWLMRIVILVWIVSAVFVAFLVNKLNGVVHGDLYNYGLQFSFGWALPYWSFERFIYICLAVPAALSGVALVLDFWRRGKGGTPEVKYVKSKPISDNVKVQTMNGKENTMLINCPKCHKVFGKPLSMLDFSGGKTRLVNVCPYCNHVLGDADDSSSDDIRVADTEEEVVQER